MKILNTLIVDDHPVVRDGLRMMLESNKSEFNFIVEEAKDGKEALRKVSEKHFEFVIMDYQLPDIKGDEATKELLKIDSKSLIIGLSNYDEYIYASNMLKAGARGYVLKNIDSIELILAIKKIVDGQLYYSADIANKLITVNMMGLEADRQVPGEVHKKILTKREIEIIKLIADELTNEEISKHLELSKRTVDNHRQNILNKLKLRNTAGLIRFAMENELI